MYAAVSSFLYTEVDGLVCDTLWGNRGFEISLHGGLQYVDMLRCWMGMMVVRCEDHVGWDPWGEVGGVGVYALGWILLSDYWVLKRETVDTGFFGWTTKYPVYCRIKGSVWDTDTACIEIEIDCANLWRVNVVYIDCRKKLLYCASYRAEPDISACPTSIGKCKKRSFHFCFNWWMSGRELNSTTNLKV